LGARKFDRDFVPEDASVEELLRVQQARTLSEDAARDLYRRLSRYFAQKGIQNLSSEDRRKYGKQGGLKRWGKTETPKEGS
jgi:hypothetical protein